MASDLKSSVKRIQQAKTDIASAIAEKGVTVPEGTKIDGMSELIAQIPSGGGTDTADATATAADIAWGKTAYTKGEKIIGNISTIASAGTTPVFSSDQIRFYHNGQRRLVDKSSFFYASASAFGNATAEDVMAGKTFTSAAGLAVTGTAESGYNLKTGSITLEEAAKTLEIDTGLSEIAYMAVWLVGSINDATMVQMVYNGAEVRYSACTKKSITGNEIGIGKATFTCEGGKMTIQTIYSFANYAPYNWFAVGK